MADTSTSLFYNSENGDRLYDADSFEHLLKKFFKSGVFEGDCQVTADGTDMTVTMAAGYSNCDGKIRFFTESEDLTLANAHATYDRIDLIVIERNDSDREITAKVVTGTYSTTPIAPTPVRSSGVYQLVVAEIYVSAGSVRIRQSDITDMRPDSTVCGYVMCAVDTPDFTSIYAQFLEQFQTWFNEMKDQLSTDAAGNLQNEIDALIVTPDADINIPASGESATYSLLGLTATYEVIRWNFSSSAENDPPCDLRIVTAADEFTIYNDGGSTSETVHPVFALPAELYLGT